MKYTKTISSTMLSILALTGHLLGSPTDREQQWAELQPLLSTMTGRYTEAPPVEKVVTHLLTAGMLLGNGGFGVVSDAREGEQSYYMAGCDVWNNGQKIMNAQLKITAGQEETKIRDEKPGRFNITASDSLLFHSEPENAFDSNDATGWYSDTQAARVDRRKIAHDKWIMIQSPEKMNFDRLEIRHYGSIFPEYSFYNTYDYQVQVSDDGKQWDTIKTIKGNRDNVNVFSFEKPVSAKLLRVYITTPVNPEHATKHYPNDMTNARIIGINMFMGGDDIVRPAREQDGSYLHEQDILKAEVRSRIKMEGKTVSFRSWTADDRNLLVTDIKLEEKAGSPVRLKVELTAPDSFNKTPGATNNMIWLTRESGRSFKSHTATSAKIVKGRHILQDGYFLLELKPGEEAQIATFAHSRSGVASKDIGVQVIPIEEVKKDSLDRLKSISPASIAQMHLLHLDWWKNYWLKSWIAIDDRVLQRYYYGALYGLGCTIRKTLPGAEQPNAPTGMMGLWQTTDKAHFGGAGYTNYNYEAPYYGLFSSNRAAELMIPYYEEAAVRMRFAQHAAANVGYEGAQISRVITPIQHFYHPGAPRKAADSKNHKKLPTDQKSNIMLYTQPLVWDWQYYRDDERLEQYIYPSLLKTVQFYLDFVVEKDGRFWVENSSNNELNKSRIYDVNPILDIGYIKSHFKSFVEMSQHLNQNREMLPRVRHVLDNLMPFPTSKNSPVASKKLAELGFDDKNEVLISGYFSDNLDQVMASNCPWGTYIYEGNQPVALEAVVHPAENVSLASDPALLELARNTFDYFNPMLPHYRGACYNGFPKSFTIAARLGIDGKRVIKYLRATIEAGWRENLTCTTNNHGIENFGPVEAVNSMLLQNEGNELRVFPAWDKSKNARFVDLRAKGAFLVSSEYSAVDKKILYVTIRSDKDSPVQVVSPWKNGIRIKDQNGNVVGAKQTATAHTAEPLYIFPTRKGLTYHLTENPGNHTL